ncbi:hypothetical protein L208DRAFT_1317318, partial [Tricholoma matsutake]
LANHINEPNLSDLVHLFVYHQLQSDSSNDSDASSIPEAHEIKILSPISVFHSAVATFYASSDPSGIHGMRWEQI